MEEMDGELVSPPVLLQVLLASRVWQVENFSLLMNLQFNLSNTIKDTEGNTVS